MKYRKVFLIKLLIIAVLIITSGCTGSTQGYTTPPENLTIQEAAKMMDLKTLDLGRITKNKINEVDKVSLNSYGEGYEIQYRYLNKLINVKVVKFASSDLGSRFWKKWISTINGVEPIIENKANVVVFKNQKFVVKAWQKNSWFTCISVPVDIPNCEELREQVKDYVNYCYSKL